VSVVIPVRDRRDLLTRTLDALEAQTFRDFDVVVVDDGSTDGSAEAAEQRHVAGRPVRVVRTGGVGAVMARISGVAESGAEILAFTDSDCEPASNWLASTVGVIDNGADLVHGRTMPSGPVGPLERSLWSDTEGLYPSCNLVVRRTAYDAVGGFELRHGGRGSGEDTVFGWRVARRGDVRYAEDGVVHHAVLRFDFAESVQRMWAGGDFPALAKEVPELRGTKLFRHRVLLAGPDRVPLYLAAAAAMTGRRRAALVAGAVWTGTVWRRMGTRAGTRKQRLQALPVEMLLDVVFGASLVFHSVRTRSIVL
jgi:glycosyltransferase involved in cell wall biosynthesis